MNEEKDNEYLHLPENTELAKDIRVIMTAPEFLDKIVRPPTITEWRAFVEDYLPQEKRAPDDAAIKNIMDEIAGLGNIKRHFPKNFRCCYTVIPCTPSGNEWRNQDLTGNPQIIRIMFSPDEKASPRKFFKQQQWLYEFMPEEIKNECSFNIKYNYKNKPLNADQIKTKMLADSAHALLNLRRLLKSR